MKRFSGRIFPALSALILWAGTGAGETMVLPLTSQGGVRFDLDGAAFRARGDSLRQEIYYSLPATSLAYQAVESGRYRAVFTTEIVLRDSAGIIRGTNVWKSENVIATPEEAKERRMFVSNQLELQLAPGLWQLSVTIRDSGSGKAGVVRVPLRMSPISPKLTISDLELASEVRPDTGSSIFTKNGYRVTPCADHVFGGRLAFLYWYGELYNMTLPPVGGKGFFRMDYAILDSSGKVVNEVIGEVREKPGTSVVEAGGIPIAGLQPGRYRLRLKAFDLDSKSEASREGTFEKLPLELAKATSAASAMSAEVQAYYDQIQYLASPDTVKFYQKLSPEGKKQFLEEFWKRHDLNAFVSNLKYVDEQFSGGFKKGHQTDRGRIFLKYGKPDEIVPHPADEQYWSHEIWYYYSQGGKRFVFSDLTGYGKYELVYSSVPGESSNPKWQTLFDASELNR